MSTSTTCCRACSTSTGFDYWESGQDFLRGNDVYKNFIRYQSKLLPEFRHLARQYDFNVIDARRNVLDIFTDLKAGIQEVVKDMIEDQPTSFDEITLDQASALL